MLRNVVNNSGSRSWDNCIIMNIKTWIKAHAPGTMLNINPAGNYMFSFGAYVNLGQSTLEFFTSLTGKYITQWTARREIVLKNVTKNFIYLTDTARQSIHLKNANSYITMLHLIHRQQAGAIDTYF